jgi:hypothetical protein
VDQQKRKIQLFGTDLFSVVAEEEKESKFNFFCKFAYVVGTRECTYG